MNLNDQLLAALVQYGLPALFGVILIASAGVPLPVTLLLVAAGSFVAQGDLDLWWVLGMGVGGAVLGDQLGYALGRWGGRRLVSRLSRWIGGEVRLRQAEAAARRWGGAGIFLSRWLLTPLGPTINLTSGIAGYPWPAFLLFDVAGEGVWVAIYVMVGVFFSDRVQALSDLLGNLTWALVGSGAVVALGWMLARQLRAARAQLQVDRAEVPGANP